MKRLYKLSGLSYFMIFLSGFYANFVILESNIDKTNSFITTSNFINNHNQLSNGILGFLIMITFDLVLVWSLFFITKPISIKLSYASSSLRLLHASAFCLALYQLYKIYYLTFGNVTNSSNLQQTITTLLSNFDTIWTVGLLFFGVHLLFLGYLAIKSTIFPKPISVLLIIASLGYLIDSSAKLIYSGYENYRSLFETGVLFTGVVGELSFTIWLLYKGFKTRIKHKIPTY